jgi:LuxR family transcriptional regulator, maltose regulon positive regulatory protein
MPRPLSDLVERPRVLEMVDAGVSRPLTLISAPPGAGKTALLAHWFHAGDHPGPAVWLPLRREHTDRRRFWAGVVSALGGIDLQLAGLAVPPRDALEPFLITLLARLDELEEPVTLVLDDLQVVSVRAILADLDWLLDVEPAGVRLVVATRSDPTLRLQRLRAAGRLAEVRAGDLAFTLGEARELLDGLDLDEGDVELLWQRTEGWATGLRLAHLSLERRKDRHAFIQSFAGGDAAVSDYLLSEVIAGETEAALEFMMRTSVPDALCGSLAETLTGDAGAAHRLRELARRNAFVTEMEQPAGWYRYHRLFADVLRAELHRRRPGSEAGLHSLAGRWYADREDPLEALRHSVAAADWQLAAEVLGEHWLRGVLRGGGAVLLELASAIPDEVVRSDAELALAVGGLLLDQGDRDAADRLLLEAYDTALKLPDERRRRFAVTSTATSLYRARLSGDVAEALDAARQVLDESWDRAVATDVRALTLANLGIAEYWTGGLREAGEHLQQAAGLALECRNDFVLFLAESYAAAVDVRDGQLTGAERRARTALQLAERRGWTRQSHAAVALVARATVHLWRDELPEAERSAEEAAEALGRVSEPLLGALVAQLRARLLMLRGEPLTALGLLRGVRAHGRLPRFLHVVSGLLEAELWLALGEPVRARAALLELEGADAPDPAVGLARLELACGNPEAALGAVDTFAADGSEPLLPFTRLEAWVVAAIAHDALRDQDRALEALERALDLAEPRGFSNILTRYGPPVRSLLRRRIAQGTAHRALADAVLAGLDEGAAAERGPASALLEPLSERELTVLRFLPTMMSNAEIAAEMFVSVNTVKTHLKHVYRKLDVTDRRDCVKRARELRLLGSGLRAR